MKTQSIDTPPEIERIIMEGYRKMSFGKKMELIDELNVMLDSFVRSDVRSRHPDADEREVRLRIASRQIPPELMKKAFGWDVEKEGY